MKKYALLGVIALVMLLVAPAMAADIAPQAGVKAEAINVWINGYATPSFGYLKMGDVNVMDPSTAQVHATVVGGNVKSWSVVASTPATTFPGHMYGTAGFLNMPFFISCEGSGWINAATEFPWTIMSGTAETPDTFKTLSMSQGRVLADADGDYHIDIAFTGMVTGE